MLAPRFGAHARWAARIERGIRIKSLKVKLGALRRERRMPPQRWYVPGHISAIMQGYERTHDQSTDECNPLARRAGSGRHRPWRVGQCAATGPGSRLVRFRFPFYFGAPAYYPPPVYYPPPAYNPPPPYQPQAYAPPPAAYSPPAEQYSPAGGQACIAGTSVCPMEHPTAAGSACYCTTQEGRAWGHST